MILGIAGSLQSGKSTRVNFLHGHIMQQNNIIEQFHLDDQGRLIVSALFDEGDTKVKGMGRLDLEDEREGTQYYLSQNVWPYIKQYSFASPIKEICIDILGLSRQSVYGSGDDKNTKTHLKWEDMPGVYTNKKMYDLSIEANPDLAKVLMYHKSGYMTAREVMQFVGSDIFRKMMSSVWYDFCSKSINEERTKLAVISDVRYEDEIDWIHSQGGKTIALLRNSNPNGHQSEGIEKSKKHDFVIDNRDLTVEECNSQFLDKLREWEIV